MEETVMNKRIRNKIAKRQHQNAPLVERLRDDLTHAVDSVVADVKAVMKSHAPEIEQRSKDLQEVAKKVPVIGEAAAEKIDQLGKRLTFEQR